MTSPKYADPVAPKRCTQCGREHTQRGGFCSHECFDAWLDRQDAAGLRQHINAAKAEERKP